MNLHTNDCLIVVIDDHDKVLLEKRVPNDLAGILQLLAAYRHDLAGVVEESTYNWHWLVDGLIDAGYEVKLANPSAIKKYEGLKHSGDEADARYLAHLLRLGILPTGSILPPELRATRDLAKKRMQLVRSRTQHILAAENITAREYGSRISSNQVMPLDAEDVDAMPLPEDVKYALKANVAVVKAISEQIKMLEKRIQERVISSAEYRLLRSVPGIGKMLAPVILLETGPIDRFKQVGNFVSYARCLDSEHSSNGKKKGEGNTKNGDKYLAWAFIEAANFARRYNNQARRFYKRKKAKTNTAVATKALAHKLARACYHIMKDGKPFEVGRCKLLERKNFGRAPHQDDLDPPYRTVARSVHADRVPPSPGHPAMPAVKLIE
ncbi:IS110 family transposase [Noviherbaspirillum sp. L7-7A]|uniref:IS110 family transposase n=1 Tax=Noviherbaspirillum sp. L7-7A TaxID=2850560 RepID=UPI0032C3F01E